MLRKWPVITIALCLVIIVFSMWQTEEKASAKTAVVRPQHYVAAEGRVAVKPDRRAVLSAEVAGRIDQIFVDNLSPVQKGQLLAVLYNTDLEQRIHQTDESYRKAQANYQELANGFRKEEVQEAAANVQRAESDLELALKNEERERQLFEQQIVAQSRFDAAVAERKRAEAELQASRERYHKYEQGERSEVIRGARAAMESEKYAHEALKASYEKTFIRSPLNGIVILRYRNASEFADVGNPILEVADLSELIIEGDVNEIDAGKVATGRKAIITSDSFPGQEFRGEVYEVSAALKRRQSDPEDPAVIVDQKILPVKVRLLQNAPLKLGMKVDIKILL